MISSDSPDNAGHNCDASDIDSSDGDDPTKTEDRDYMDSSDGNSDTTTGYGDSIDSSDSDTTTGYGDDTVTGDKHPRSQRSSNRDTKMTLQDIPRVKAGLRLPSDHRLLSPDVTRQEVIEDIQDFAPELSSNHPRIKAFLQGLGKTKFIPYTIPDGVKTPSSWAHIEERTDRWWEQALENEPVVPNPPHGFAKPSPTTPSHLVHLTRLSW